jgi:UDP-glucuronate 4-epimerase
MKAKLNMMPMQDGDVKNSNADITGLIREFNYTTEWDIKIGTKEFIKWYLGYYKVK